MTEGCQWACLGVGVSRLGIGGVEIALRELQDIKGQQGTLVVYSTFPGRCPTGTEIESKIG